MWESGNWCFRFVSWLIFSNLAFQTILIQYLMSDKTNPQIQILTIIQIKSKSSIFGYFQTSSPIKMYFGVKISQCRTSNHHEKSSNWLKFAVFDRKWKKWKIQRYWFRIKILFLAMISNPLLKKEFWCFYLWVRQVKETWNLRIFEFLEISNILMNKMSSFPTTSQNKKKTQDAGCMNIKSSDESMKLSSKWTYGLPSGPSWIGPLFEHISIGTFYQDKTICNGL